MQNCLTPDTHCVARILTFCFVTLSFLAATTWLDESLPASDRTHTEAEIFSSYIGDGATTLVGVLVTLICFWIAKPIALKIS